jgi:hypothetical protein
MGFADISLNTFQVLSASTIQISTLAELMVVCTAQSEYDIIIQPMKGM